jgi:hypothetical protein
MLSSGRLVRASFCLKQWSNQIFLLPTLRLKKQPRLQNRGWFLIFFQSLRCPGLLSDEAFGHVDKHNKLAQEVYESLGMKKDHYELYERLK